MKFVFALALSATSLLAQDWRSATPGWQYEFPRDHHVHREFKTEWWYFTGNVFDKAGRRFGFELTFFREGIIPPAQRTTQRSRFVVDDLKFAHFTVTDEAGQKFRFDQKASRGAFGEAGFDRGDQIAWINDWFLRIQGDEFHLAASTPNASVDLVLAPQKPPVVHGRSGISLKAAGENHASHYYSVTRLATRGSIRIGAREFPVSGASWFDHEWATNQLAPNQVGWNWLCVQFANGTELMLYQMRLADGTLDVASSGTLVASDGVSTHLSFDDFAMTPLAWWHSGKTNSDYPVEWQINVPSCQMNFSVRPVLQDQELALQPLVYWEGAIRVTGTHRDERISGDGYLELTGYAGSLRELAR
ncbi:MAG TPA: lipocalin-like domain-containing protein [Chthoniobacterales bacterium]|jgi:predicted secreted hydrolase